MNGIQVVRVCKRRPPRTCWNAACPAIYSTWMHYISLQYGLERATATWSTGAKSLNAYHIYGNTLPQDQLSKSCLWWSVLQHLVISLVWWGDLFLRVRWNGISLSPFTKLAWDYRDMYIDRNKVRKWMESVFWLYWVFDQASACFTWQISRNYIHGITLCPS